MAVVTIRNIPDSDAKAWRHAAIERGERLQVLLLKCLQLGFATLQEQPIDTTLSHDTGR